jgi:hypothetical protein
LLQQLQQIRNTEDSLNRQMRTVSMGRTSRRKRRICCKPRTICRTRSRPI